VGAIADEYLAAYIKDRTSTFATAFLGLTLACCECHDHKFDPFTQREYYQLFAYFNGVPEKGLDGRKEMPRLCSRCPRLSKTAKLAALRTKISEEEKEIAERRQAERSRQPGRRRPRVKRRHLPQSRPARGTAGPREQVSPRERVADSRPIEAAA